MKNLSTPSRSPRRFVGALAAAAVVLGLSTTALAKSSYLNTWRSAYPGSSSDDNVISGTGSSCQLCHGLSGNYDSFNAYGWEMRQNLNTMSLSAAIAACEPVDSDGDPTGSDNLAEINADAQPGWTGGANNTIYFKNGSTQTGQTPPSITGDLDPPGCTVTTYCTSSATSIPGCSASISSSGTPSVSQPDQFQISSGNVPGSNLGLMYFSDKGRASIPFGTQGGFVCAQPGFRSKPKASGGTQGSCSGNYVFSLTDLINSSNGVILAGNTINAAVWFRDPASVDTFGLSNGIEFTLCP
jgi:hypothetical protein